MLIIRPDHIGDMLFAVPALGLLRQRYPSAHIAALVGPWATTVVEHSGVALDEILECDFPWFNRHARRSFWEPYSVLRREASRIQAGHYDVVVNLRFDFWWGALLANLAGIPHRLGYDTSACLPFLTDPVPYTTGHHEVEQNLRIVKALDRLVPAEARSAIPPALQFQTTPTETIEAQTILANADIRSEDVVVAVHPGAGAIAKRWPLDRFASVIDTLASDYGVEVVLTGSVAEQAIAEQVSRWSRARPRSIAGLTSLGQLAAVFRRCRLVIGVDSGPMHLAVAVGAPTIHIYGPSDPVAFGPYGDPRKHQVVSAGYGCAPCGRFLDFDREADCMYAIGTDRVLEAVARAMAPVPQQPLYPIGGLSETKGNGIGAETNGPSSLHRRRP